MNPEAKTGVTFDCMVYLQALANAAGPAAACFRLLEMEPLTLFTREPVLREIRDVLDRPRIRQKNPNITDETVDRLLGWLAVHAVEVPEVPNHFTYERDPKDEKYVNLAVTAKARYLVSRDKDLLDLRADAAFQKQFPELRILTPTEFLREFESRPAQQQGSEDIPAADA